MKYLLKHIPIVFLLIGLTSCDVVTSLLTTNYFEGFSDINPFSLVVDENSFPTDDDEAAILLINKYTDVALSDDAENFFAALKGLDTYRSDLIAYYNSILITKPDNTLPTYLDDIDIYQRRSLALAKIELYTRNAYAIDGFDRLYTKYVTGEEDADLTINLLIENVFNTEDPDVTRVSLEDDFQGFFNAGDAIDLLGKTIVDTDNPTSKVLDENEGVFILLSSIINRVVELSLEGDLSNTKNENDVFVALAAYVLNGTTSSLLVYPQDLPPEGGQSMIEHYLGLGGALAYTASGFELPGVSILGGSQL
ncbi:hypothetical protein EW093_13735 [Thiospirochaeta perfilievii]|uniref:Uncharacterized protein n=1 Tax=Thiospirochaeta perfilievii TaxID=252967 RepID=A0A5C1QEC1_9SPIO|nr:hypothetical protein [Thiospirochaeta perfilievii]QEN05728.1 hypothetical protein EW093_13735 [Thiospirochaeta perfilievii]